VSGAHPEITLPPPSAHGAKKKRLRRVPPEPAVVSNTPIKMMDGNPLGQSRDLSLDDQDTPRTDYNNPSKANDHEVESRMWVSAPLTKQKKKTSLNTRNSFADYPGRLSKRPSRQLLG
jgi:hypothetical protein